MSQETKVESASVAASTDALATPDTSASHLAKPPSTWLDRGIDLLVENLSSILVKEGRQAIKSFQFMGTYAMLVAAVITWTVLALVMVGSNQSSINAEDFASSLISGFLVILGIPLGIIVPFSAYRSLAREYDDGTIQMIAITTMKPYQIVLGKLATAILQMIIYLSVIAPCVAFTTMLDGVSYIQITLGLSITVIGCLVLTIMGLMLAGASRSYALGIAISVGFVLLLGLVFFGWCSFVGEVLGSTSDLNRVSQEEGFYRVIFSTAGFVLSTGMVMLAAAASQISFSTDNRSTLIRSALLLQLVIFFASIVMWAPLFSLNRPPAYVIYVVFIGHYWLIIGCLLVGESGDMSRRVLRGMPKTWYGKWFGALFMPGPGRGYLFALACMFSCTGVVALVNFNWEWFSINDDLVSMTNAGWGGMPAAVEGLEVVLIKNGVLLAFPVLFLSVTYLVMELLRRFSHRKMSGAAGPVVSLLVGSFFVFALTSFSLGVSEYSQYSGSELDAAPSMNWYFTIAFLSDRIDADLLSLAGDLANGMWIYLVAFLAGTTAFLLASSELRHEALATPDRVTQDLAESRKPKDDGESFEDLFDDLAEPPQSQTNH